MKPGETTSSWRLYASRLMLKWLGGIGEYECVLVGNKSIVIPPYNKSRMILVRYGTILVKFTTLKILNTTCGDVMSTWLKIEISSKT